MSNAKQVLSCALVLLGDGHLIPPPDTASLAVDENGRRVKPTDDTAVKWTSIGAVHRAAPVHRVKVWADTDSAGWEACMLLDAAALLQGFPNTVEVDRAGLGSVYQAFHCAMNLYEPPRRGRLRSVGTGTNPRGAIA